ncbi:AP-3 complex subunit mu-2 [Tachysurus ichikawai]
MIHSLFLVNSTGDIFLEKHWKSVVSRSVCDYFFEAQERASEPENVPPVIPTPHHYLINVLRHRIYFVAVIQSEVPPLFVIEFLHRVVDTFQDYFGVCSEAAIKDNVVVVYELLEEMLDNGFPLATESNILKELIKPPTILRTVVNTITGSTNVGEQLPTGQLSVVPWRRTGVKYTNNEAYFDVVEEIDAIIDKSGSTITAEIQGVIDACVKLTGMPDLTLSFMNPRLLDDVSFHPCVRFKRWEAERILSFIPPDGNFRLLSYHVSSQK